MALLSSVLTKLNAHETTFNYYLASVDMPLSLLLLLTLICGALFGLLLTIGMMLSERTEKNRLRHTLKLRDEEIRNLRDIPIRGRH
jgi:uncharacterized integral membrane protein